MNEVMMKVTLLNQRNVNRPSSHFLRFRSKRTQICESLFSSHRFQTCPGQASTSEDKYFLDKMSNVVEQYAIIFFLNDFQSHGRDLGRDSQNFGPRKLIGMCIDSPVLRDNILLHLIICPSGNKNFTTGPLGWVARR